MELMQNLSIILVNIENTIASGGATFNAINSVDEGGNTGWNFISGTNPLFSFGGI